MYARIYCIYHACMPAPSSSIMPGRTWRDNGHKALCPLSESCCYGTLCATSPRKEPRGKTSKSIGAGGVVLALVVVGAVVGAVGRVALKRYGTAKQELQQPLSSHTNNNEPIN